MPEELAQVKSRFDEIFGGGGGKIHVIRAPGRVNLIGEHTDYNEGFVFPMAIEPHVLLVCRSREDERVHITSTSFPDDRVEFSLNARISPGQPTWGNYSRGVAAEMLAAGIPLTGMDALIANTLPVGGGLSSSAAIEIATAQAFLTLAGLKMEPARLAMLCQKAEHEYAGVPVGIMDQTIVAGAKPGHAMLLDCRDLSRQFVLIDERELRIVIVNTMVRHELGDGEYGQRRSECQQGVEHFRQKDHSIRALRDVSMKQLEEARQELSDVVFRRCRHVISENARTTDAAVALGRRDYERFGDLMVHSHRSLQKDYEVSIPQLDFLVDELLKLKGTYGARMTGGGFGGCVVAAMQSRAVEGGVSQIVDSYRAKFGVNPDTYVTSATAGVTVLE